jgi:hypothetical protein
MDSTPICCFKVPQFVQVPSQQPLIDPDHGAGPVAADRPFDYEAGPYGVNAETSNCLAGVNACLALDWRRPYIGDSFMSLSSMRNRATALHETDRCPMAAHTSPAIKQSTTSNAAP